MQTQNTETTGYNELMINQALQETRRKLGLVPSELEDVRRRMNKALKHESNDRGAVVSWLQWYEVQATYEPLNAATLTEAREYLGLDQDELALVCGFKESKHRHQHISRMESNRREITSTMSRLIRSFLAGYRSPDWPNQT